MAMEDYFKSIEKPGPQAVLHSSEVVEAAAVREAQIEAEYNVDVLATVSTVYVALEAFHDDLQATTAAMFTPQVRVWVNHRLAALQDYTHLNCPRVSLESSNDDFRTVSLEGVGDALKAVWKAITDAVAAVWKAVVDFIKRLFGFKKNSIAKVKDINARLKEAKVDDPVKAIQAPRNTQMEAAVKKYVAGLVDMDAIKKMTAESKNLGDLSAAMDQVFMTPQAAAVVRKANLPETVHTTPPIHLEGATVVGVPAAAVKKLSLIRMGPYKANIAAWFELCGIKPKAVKAGGETHYIIKFEDYWEFLFEVNNSGRDYSAMSKVIGKMQDAAKEYEKALTSIEHDDKHPVSYYEQGVAIRLMRYPEYLYAAFKEASNKRGSFVSGGSVTTLGVVKGKTFGQETDKLKAIGSKQISVEENSWLYVEAPKSSQTVRAGDQVMMIQDNVMEAKLIESLSLQSQKVWAGLVLKYASKGNVVYDATFKAAAAEYYSIPSRWLASMLLGLANAEAWISSAHIQMGESMARLAESAASTS